MESADAVERVIITLNRLEIPYMIVGSFSSNAYGVARTTEDADFVIQADDRIGEIREALAGEWAMEPQVGFETKLMTTKYLFHHRSTGFKLEVFVLSDDPHDQERFRRRKRIDRGDLVAYLPTPEDVIIQKIRWARRKDREDVEKVIRVRGDRLDWPYVYRWCDEHGTRALLDEIRRESLLG